MEDSKWIRCPVCKIKTRTMIREDTELKNLPLFCPKCIQQTLINLQNMNMTFIKESDAQTRDHKAILKKTDIEPIVIEAIRKLIKNQDFAAEIKSRIGKEIDTSTLNREISNYESKLREVELNKTRLENEIDSLPENTRFREHKLHDMTLRP